jgi:tetratricopeptide (TPR) repeat protein
VALSLDHLAKLYIALGRAKDAEALYDEAQAILETALGASSPAIAGVLNNKALLLAHLKHREEAIKLTERAIDLLRSGAKTETPALATALFNLSQQYAASGRHADAAAARAQSDAITKKLFGDRRPPVIKFVLPVWQQDT